MSTKFSKRVLDSFIAPGYSDFNSAEIPDMSAYDSESGYWVRNHFINSAAAPGAVTLRPPLKAYVYNYMRRAEAAFSEHEQARQATLTFLASDRLAAPISLYASALLHWEFFLSQSWQSYELLRGLVSIGGQKLMLFTRNDGSVKQRLHALYSSMKHVESRIAGGHILDDAPVPVWLTNEGIRDTDWLLQYGETGDILKEIAKWAETLVHPREIPNKLPNSLKDLDLYWNPPPEESP